MLKELVDLLTCRELESEELESRVAAIEGAADDPHLHWVEDRAPERLTQSAIISHLSDFIAYSSKIDEVHEQISDFFADPLPDYPLHEDGRRFQPDEYFVWLDRQFVQLIGQKGGYELLLLRQNHTDYLHAMTVLRPDTARILQLAAESGLIIERATERNRIGVPEVPMGEARRGPGAVRNHEGGDMLKELVDLLTCRELDAEELASLAASIEGAADDPEFEWMEDPEPDELRQTALVFKLMEHFAVGDKIDEVHELISEWFSEPLPDFPDKPDGSKLLVSEYFAWLDPLLAERQDNGGYEALVIDDRVSDNLNVILAWRADTPRILELATQLALVIDRSHPYVLSRALMGV